MNENINRDKYVLLFIIQHICTNLRADMYLKCQELSGKFHVPGSQDQAGWLWWPLPAPGPRLPGCSGLPPAPFHVMLRGTAGSPLGGHQKARVPASPAAFAPRPCIGVL